mmetsp:Transcript_12019/g.32194  ORF Transcript_12019/g.32194 Transcript_12019/m.32194 type:complete len:200 (+) Transcript_12019:441-1040(+)
MDILHGRRAVIAIVPGLAERRHHLFSVDLEQPVVDDRTLRHIRQDARLGGAGSRGRAQGRLGQGPEEIELCGVEVPPDLGVQALGLIDKPIAQATIRPRRLQLVQFTLAELTAIGVVHGRVGLVLRSLDQRKDDGVLHAHQRGSYVVQVQCRRCIQQICCVCRHRQKNACHGKQKRLQSLETVQITTSRKNGGAWGGRS